MATLNFRSPAEILEALKGFLEEATWNGERAFQRVSIFDITDVDQAVEDLIISESRVALIIYSGDQWENLVKQQDMRLVCKRTTMITLVVSDRVIGDRQDAVFGSETNPGCLPLQELAIVAASGQLFAEAPYVLCTPANNEPQYVEKEGSKHPGRTAAIIALRCVTDWSDLVTA